MAKRPKPLTPHDVVANITALRAERGPLKLKEQTFARSPSPEQRRHLAGGNGGPALEDPVALKPGAALVLRTGELLFGDRHTTDLARTCAEDPRAVRRWAAGEGSGPGPGATLLLRREVERRIAKLREALEEIDYFRELRGWPVPPAPPPPPAPEVILAPGVSQEDAAWFIDQFARGDGGRPTPIRVILSAKRPPKGRRWAAEVILFDWSRQTIDCDRGADLGGGAVGFAAATVERPEPRIMWDDATGCWVRKPDWTDEYTRLRERQGATAQEGQV
ncbi:hypothetical protein [Methylobacterium sp. SD21]|uniref:hypothetical protein n=1 Tax=Methylobacterium litchii TaxID=3138810 RepID=UPI00313BC8E3